MRGTWMVVALAVACSGSSLPEMQVEEGSPEHRQLLQRQCDRGDATGCEGLGALMVADGEHAAARGLFQRACDGLSASGCYRLGELLDDERAGVDVPGSAIRRFSAGPSVYWRPADPSRRPAIPSIVASYMGDFECENTTQGHKVQLRLSWKIR